MHVTNAYVILFLASAKTGDTGIHLKCTFKNISKNKIDVTIGFIAFDSVR